LRLGDFPVFYYPFTLPFPLGDARSSGLLVPSTGSTRSGGFDFELPYYFNLAPHYDATLSTRFISDRGVLAGAELRYLANSSMNTLNISGLSSDKLYDTATANVPGSDSPPVEDRWFIGFEHTGSLGRNWTTFIDYNAVSDEDYFYDLGSSGLNLISRTHLNRQGTLNFNSEYLRAGLNVQRIQIIDPLISTVHLSRPYDRLPQFHFQSDANLPAGFRVSIRGEITSFDRDLNDALLTPSQIANGALVNGERINLEPEISWSLENPGWFVRTGAKYKHVEYSLEKHAIDSPKDPDLGIGIYSLDAGLVFERSMARGGGGWSQTLEPRVYYLYSEYEDQSMLPLFDTSELNFNFKQLFRDDRFSGGDRIGDSDQVTFALTSRILNSTGKETARISIGQTQYFEDRLVALSNPLQSWVPRYSPLTTKSALATELAFNFGEKLQFNTDIQWNEDTQELDEGSFQLRYQRDNNHLLNVAYRYRTLVSSPSFSLPVGIDPRIKQTDISGIWPVNANWKLLARWNYDHSNSRNLESFVGVEWSNCCATIRLIGREWVDEDELFLPNIESNRGIFVQFALKGLGNLTGGGLSSLLSDGIWGFREDNYGQ
jgi:LPS-assembly protein